MGSGFWIEGEEGEETHQLEMSLYLRVLPCRYRSIVYPLLFSTKMIGLSPCRIMADSSCTVNCLHIAHRPSAPCTHREKELSAALTSSHRQ